MDDLALTFTVPKETAAKLRDSAPRRRLGPTRAARAPEPSAAAAAAPLPDSWEERDLDADLALPQPGAENEPEDKPKAGEADECDEAFDPDDLPVLLVDVRALCGGTVLEPDARVEARARLRAMLTDEPRDFAARSSELFDAGFALHSTASVAAELVAMLEVRADGDADGDADADADGAASGGQQPRPQLEVVAYPSEYYAPRAPGAAEAGSATVSTQALWEQVRNGSARDGWRWRCVAETRAMLADASRELSWKAHMAVELEALAEASAARGAKLAQLHEVRRLLEARVGREESRAAELLARADVSDAPADANDTQQLRRAHAALAQLRAKHAQVCALAHELGGGGATEQGGPFDDENAGASDAQPPDDSCGSESASGEDDEPVGELGASISELGASDEQANGVVLRTITNTHGAGGAGGGGFRVAEALVEEVESRNDASTGAETAESLSHVSTTTGHDADGEPRARYGGLTATATAAPPASALPQGILRSAATRRRVHTSDDDDGATTDEHARAAALARGATPMLSRAERESIDLTTAAIAAREARRRDRRRLRRLRRRRLKQRSGHIGDGADQSASGESDDGREDSMALPRPPPVSAAVSEMARLVVASAAGDSVSAADDAELAAEAPPADESAGRAAPQGSGSVLDDILAMILGRYPRVPGASDEEHFSWIREAHEDLKGLWREELGLLPKAEDAHVRGAAATAAFDAADAARRRLA